MNVTKIILDGQVADIPRGGGSEPVDTYTKEEIDQKIAEAISGINITLPFEHSTVEKEVGTWFGKKLYAISGTASTPTSVGSTSTAFTILLRSFTFGVYLSPIVDKVIDVFAWIRPSTNGIGFNNRLPNYISKQVKDKDGNNIYIGALRYAIGANDLNNIKTGFDDASLQFLSPEYLSALTKSTVYATIYYTKK